jgi:predicted permease
MARPGIAVSQRAIARLSRCAPAWRREEWRAEWLAEIHAAASPSPGREFTWVAAACVHLLWLWSREWSLAMIGSDLKFSVRSLVRQPAFSLTAILTLVLGIGATTAMFTLVNAVLLRPLPYAHPDRIVAVWPGTSFSPERLGTAQDGRGVFDVVGGYSGWGMTITGATQAEALDGARVTPSLFTVLGVRPVAGRLLQSDEDRPGRDAVALISEGYAARRFGGAQAAIGQHLIVNGVESEVIGVMPAAFAFPDARADIWTPITVDPSREDYGANFAQLLGRLAPGVTADAAQARMLVYAEELRRLQPKQYSEKFIQRALVVPLQRRMARDVRTPLLLLFGGVTLLLAIACANVGILMLTRASSRQVEIAIRAALGAERLRIVRQLLVESVLISGLGGLGGVLLAVWLVSLAVPFVPADLAHTGRASIDATVLAFVAFTVMASALFFGLVPAAQLSRSDVRQVLSTTRGSEQSHQGRRLRSVLVFAEIALATVLVISAALLGRSFVGLTNVPLGFDPAPVLALRVSLPPDRYQDPAQVTLAFDDVVNRVSHVAGVERAGAIQLLPLTPDNWNPGVVVEGVPAADQYPSDVNWRLITPDYLSAMSIPLRSGRGLASTDTAGRPSVAVVNETFARLVFRGEDPIGKRLRTGFEDKNDWVEVVGVVGDLHQHTFEDPAQPELYRPFAQHPIGSMWMMVRAAGDPGATAAAVRDAIGSVDANIVVSKMEPMAAVVDRTLGSRRAPLTVAVVFAIAAMTLGLVGVTGVLSFDVAQRRREIGIRLALGASPSAIQRAVIVRGLVIAVAGIATGVAGAALSARALQSMLFGVSPTDPLTIASVAAAFLVVMCVAMYAPSRRAAHIDPLQTMKD